MLSKVLSVLSRQILPRWSASPLLLSCGTVGVLEMEISGGSSMDVVPPGGFAPGDLIEFWSGTARAWCPGEIIGESDFQSEKKPAPQCALRA